MTYVTNATSEQTKAGTALACELCILPNLGPAESVVRILYKPWASGFTLHCSNSLSCINEYMAIDIGGYLSA